MSLINRMLDDLASRQAPGTESLQGVRLNEPLQAAHAGLDRRMLVVLLIVIAAVAGALWWWWPGRVAIPVPQARSAPEPVIATVAPPPAIPTAAAPADPTVPQLQLSPRLASLDEREPEVLDDAERVEREQTVEPPPPSPPKAAKPRASTPRPPPLTTEPATSSPIIAAAAPVAAPVDPLVERKQRARQALADQDPAAALSILSSTDAARDVESAALRAAALQRLGRHAEAADAYAALTARDPSEPGHWVGLGISLERVQRRDQARMAYRRALQSDRLAPSLRAFAQDRATVLETP